jgi:polar amino acid transport system permease protein
MEELLRRTELLVQVKFKVLELFCVAALYYLVLTTLWGFVQNWLEARASRSVTSRYQTPAVAADPINIDNTVLSHDAS